jgi:chromosome segregation protein
MGESSAKQLRGAAMSDVIFNGSRTRKAIDQASKCALLMPAR